jgi:tRNA-Thr(GGU) m(6)t(6)A37 methyltransferase TsaA
MQPICFDPIGIIHTPFQHEVGMPLQPLPSEGYEGRIELLPEYAEGLQDIEGFSHLHVLWHFHVARGSALRVTPFLDTTQHGVFATRSPKRPNGIALSIVRLIRRESQVLYVQDVDMVDGTPVLDIKPYVPQIDVRQTDRIGWYAGKVEGFQTKRADDRFARR